MINKVSLDRFITGNYGEDQYREEEPECDHRQRVFLGEEEQVGRTVLFTVPVYQCRGCGDLFDEPGRDCSQPMRTGYCMLDPGHRGRHSTVGYYCDGCGKTRRSAPVAQARNPWDGIVEAQFCWFCVNVEGR